MKESKIVKYKDLELLFLDEDEIDILDGYVIFDSLKFSEDEVRKLIKLIYNNYKRREDSLDHIHPNCKDLMNEEINDNFNDLCYLVSSLIYLMK